MKGIALLGKVDSCSQLPNDEVVLRENGTLHLSLNVSYIAGKFYDFHLPFSLFLFCLKVGGVLEHIVKDFLSKKVDTTQYSPMLSTLQSVKRCWIPVM